MVIIVFTRFIRMGLFVNKALNIPNLVRQK